MSASGVDGESQLGNRSSCGQHGQKEDGFVAVSLFGRLYAFNNSPTIQSTCQKRKDGAFDDGGRFQEDFQQLPEHLIRQRRAHRGDDGEESDPE